MIIKRAATILIFFLVLQSFSAFITPGTPLKNDLIINQQQLQQEDQRSPRFLQAIFSSDSIVAGWMNKIVDDANTDRSKKRQPSLAADSDLSQKISQWSSALKDSMSLTQYLQLFGVLNIQIQTYETIPTDQVAEAISQLSLGLHDSAYTKMASYYEALDADNYEVILVFQGGFDAQRVEFTHQVIQKVLGSKKVANTTGLERKTVVNQTQIVQPKVVVPVQVPVKTVQNATVQQVQPVAQSNPLALSNFVPLQPVSPPVSAIAPAVPVPAIILTPPPVQSRQKSQPVVEPKTNHTETIKAPQLPAIPVTLSRQSSESTQPQSSTPSLPLSLPLITQTVFTTSFFENIKLSHGIPSTFLKDERFAFKGTVTVPNPSGLTVNIIFTRSSDQKRLSFGQYLPSNQTQFEVLTNLNISGTFYLSIFIGATSLTSQTQFSISPGFIGKIVSRSPSPLKQASLNLINNDLWVNWTHSDTCQPALTQITFTQDSGKSIQFLLSNYESTFKVPFREFTAFNVGTTNVQIVQAFSLSESAIARTSDFSAPFNIIFNATQHHFAFQKKNDLAAIPLKISSDDSLRIVGHAEEDLSNEISVITPSKSFVSFYFDGNSSTRSIKKGTDVSSSLAFTGSGVYILEVTNTQGATVVNIPVYVGDIYPLLPDFKDLAPTSIDIDALNEPQIIDDRRSLIVSLINSIRTTFGVPNLYLDAALSNRAQNSSFAEIQTRYFEHSSNSSRNQTLPRPNIYSNPKDNFIISKNLTEAQLLLQRSPSHLRNMIDPQWSRVGLGIAQDVNHQYYLTESFSTRDLQMYPLTSSELSGIQGIIVNYLQSQNPNVNGEAKALGQKLNSYQAMPNPPEIGAYLASLGYQNTAVASSRVNYNNGNFMDQLRKDGHLSPPSASFKQIALSVAYAKEGLQILAVYI